MFSNFLVFLNILENFSVFRDLFIISLFLFLFLSS
jgi:hypothetical protein